MANAANRLPANAWPKMNSPRNTRTERKFWSTNGLASPRSPSLRGCLTTVSRRVSYMRKKNQKLTIAQKPASAKIELKPRGSLPCDLNRSRITAPRRPTTEPTATAMAFRRLKKYPREDTGTSSASQSL